LSLERQIRRYIETKILDGRDVEGDPLTMGALDSMAIEQLIAFLQDRYRVEFADEELDAERFASVAAVASLVREKQRGRRRPAGRRSTPT
jgi:acyl carrier protein